METKLLIGVLIIIAVFAGITIFGIKDVGVKETFIAWSLTLAILIPIAIASMLIAGAI